MTWRETYADQHLRMANKMLERQGELNDAQARVKFLENRIAEVRRIMVLHAACNINCCLYLDLEEVLGDE